MNPHVNSISGRLSLRAPQRDSLETLDRVMEIGHPSKQVDLQSALSIIRSEFPGVTDFEREFPSLCFALATGVGKTRLMGAFVAYLHLAHGINNFFVMAPNLTIYRKLIQDFTPNTPKYVFDGIGELAAYPPDVITGDTYESSGQLLDDLHKVKINIFNISKINSEVRGGKSPRIKRLSEYIGQSYFDYLAGLPDLILLMDESHRYRASAGVRAINELKPILGLELTATPFVETGKGAVPFKNVIVDYPLARAIEDGFVKNPAVVTRKDFNPIGMSPGEIERLKLEDGMRLHEQVKTELATYAQNASVPYVKPFTLIIARDTTHASELLKLIDSEEFFGGAYGGKVIQVDSSKTGAEEEEMISRLLGVENAEDPTEIVIHVNMLKEGWDVKNLYTIIPLRAANARTLIEQSIGRGLRLPYGRRTGVAAVDRLNIVAHDKFQEIVDEASKPGSVIQMQRLVLTDEDLEKGIKTVVNETNLAGKLGLAKKSEDQGTATPKTEPLFTNPDEQKAAQTAYQVLQTLQTSPELAPTTASLRRPEVQALVIREVTKQLASGQMKLEGVAPEIDMAKVVEATTSLLVAETIDIPRIMVVPKEEIHGRYQHFKLNLDQLTLRSPEDSLWTQYLQSGKSEVLGLADIGVREPRLEDYVVSGLVDFDDVSYDYNSEVLYDLGRQVVDHLNGYLKPTEVERVLRFHQRTIANLVHSQMTNHFSEGDVEVESKVRRGWTELKPCAYSVSRIESVMDLRQAPSEKSKIGHYLYGGFTKSLYPFAKFHSDTERVLAIILERESLKWFRPVKGQFQLFYRQNHEVAEYAPDFVAETESCIYMIETKARNEMDTAEVQAKKAVAEEWCRLATEYGNEVQGKPWKYVLIPHDEVKENISLSVLGR